MARYTKKEKRFIEELPYDWNQTKAAIRAGYSPKTARQIAAELMTKPKIKDAIDKVRAEQSRQTGVSVELVVQELARLGRFDPRKLFNFDGSPRPITDLDNDTVAAISGLEVMDVYEGRGDNRRFVGYIKKYKFADKKGALDSLAKHLGMFSDAPVVNIHNNPFAGLTTDELRKLIQDG